jgi:hypothetical protein
MLRRQLRAPFRPAALQDEAAGLCRHARSETVCACPLDSAGLERAFHMDWFLDERRNLKTSNLKTATQK